MNTSIKLGNFLGIPIGLHASWFLIFGLITWSLATGYFPQGYPQLSSNAHLALALVTSLLFFGSVLLHEIGHSILALRNHIPVKGITLFIFGGVAQIGREPETPGAEFRIAIAGPLTSLGLAALFGGLYLLAPQAPLLAAPSLYLFRINLILALFNLIPGFPLDGGRVLRALIWKFTGSFPRATRIASIGGQVVAFGFIALGVSNMVGGQFSNGLWLVFIGWFLQNAAASALRQMNASEQLRGLTVEQAMSRNIAQIPALTPLSQIVQERVLASGQHDFVVVDYAGAPSGILALQDITNVPQLKWRLTTAADVMKPIQRLAYLAPETGLLEAMQKMDADQIAHMPVIQHDRLVGLLSREHVLRYLRLRSELGL